MKKALFLVFTVMLVLAITCGDIWAQATAQITGTVKDQTGAVLPGVEVTATQTETGIARNAVTNETGSYVLSNLAIGPYRVEATRCVATRTVRPLRFRATMAFRDFSVIGSRSCAA